MHEFLKTLHKAKGKRSFYFLSFIWKLYSGYSGTDTGIPLESKWDGSGAGGGSTSLYLDDIKLLVAGGGSGGASTMNGCDGGSIGKHFCPKSGNNCYELYFLSRWKLFVWENLPFHKSFDKTNK